MMKILIAGATGMVGSALIPHLSENGHSVVKLVRKKSEAENEIEWDSEHDTLNPASCEGFDYVINLAGENISSGRWTETIKKKIKESRIKSTRLIVDTLAKVDKKPKGLINASAVGYYGNREDQILRETDGSGDGFLAEVCREWESEAARAEKLGIRVVCTRFGMILSQNGGALKKMLAPFKLGLGGVVGSGRQYMSWIAIDDVIAILALAMQTEGLKGAVNVASPSPVQNREFTKVLGKVLNRPTFLPLPAFAARLAFGEMADELLLASTRVVPEKLTQHGYQFLYPHLEQALKYYVGRND